jgi:hypothetical protein
MEQNMKTKSSWRKRLVITAAITIGLTPAVASAVDIVIPTVLQLIPDICESITGCDVTYTNAAKAIQIEQLLGTIENLKASPNILTTIGTIRGEIPAIKAAVAAATPVHVGDAAADAAFAQSEADDKAAWMAGNSIAACTGDLCAIQADATVNGQTASNTAKANVLHEQDSAQAVNVQNAFAGHLVDEFGPAATCPICG